MTSLFGMKQRSNLLFTYPLACHIRRQCRLFDKLLHFSRQSLTFAAVWRVLRSRSMYVEHTEQ